MSEVESRLTGALRAGTPPARDARFRIEVLLRIERARFRRRVIRTLAFALAAALLLVLNAPTVVGWIDTDLWLVGTVALGAAAVMFSLAGLPIEAIPGFRGFSRTLGRWLYP